MKKMKLIYEKGKKEEINEIFQVFEQAITNMISQGIYQWDNIYPSINDIVSDLEKEHLYVGKIDNSIAAVCVLNSEYDEEYKNGAWENTEDKFMVIHRLCVSPQFQNKGIGRKTMEYIEKSLIMDNIKSIRLDTFSNNPYALNLYKSLGYKIVGEVNWRKGMFYLMEKNI